MNRLSGDDLDAATIASDETDGKDLDAGRRAPGPRLSSQLEAFIQDRFSTTLEDPYTGRRL